MGHLMAFVAFLRHHGAPADRFLRRHKLPTLCDDPDTFIPYQRALSFFDDAASHEVRELGWLVGRHVGDHNLNADLLRVIETAPTLYQSLKKFVKLISAESSDIDIDILERRNDILLYTHDPAMAKIPGVFVAEEYQLQVFLSLIRHFLGQHWIPDEIGLESTHVPPMIKAQLPGCQIQTQQIASYVAVTRSCLHRTVHPWDAKIGSAECPHVSGRFPILTNSFDYVDSLRATLMPYVSDGYPSRRVAAELMNTSIRTLTRKLHGYGFTYGKVIDELRFGLAKKQLQEQNTRIGDIARYVGFKDQSDFGRMIRRVSGMTPSELRDSLMSEDKKSTTTAVLLDS